MKYETTTSYDKIFYQTTETEVLEKLKRDPDAYNCYLRLNAEWREHFMGFCTGQKTLPLLYDSIFKKIFQPDTHPERLEGLISCILKQEVKIKTILPSESILMDGESIMVMDILVKLSDDSFVLVEIQKVPYSFPAERASSYSADLLLRQYSSVKQSKEQDFNYKDLKKVYTLLFFEKSTAEFHKNPSVFLHHSHTVTDSGISLNFLQEFYFITLDIFKKSDYAKLKNKDDRLSGWLLFLCTESADDARALCQIYPWLTDLYLEMAEYRQKPEEVLSMFSSALREMDKNTAKYMIVKQQETIDELGKVIEEKDALLAESAASLAESAASIKVKDALLAESAASIKVKDAEIARLQKALSEKN